MGQDLKANTTALEKEIPPMKKSDKSGVDRRKFLKGAAVGGMATLVASTGTVRAQQLDGAASSSRRCRRGMRIRRAKSGFDSGPLRFRLHGRCNQDSRLRVRCRQSGIQLSRHTRIADQLRRQQEPRVHHLLPRRVVGRAWRTATRKSKASRCSFWRTARWAYSMPRWVSTTPGAAGRPSSS